MLALVKINVGNIYLFGKAGFVYNKAKFQIKKQFNGMSFSGTKSEMKPTFGFGAGFNVIAGLSMFVQYQVNKVDTSMTVQNTTIAKSGIVQSASVGFSYDIPISF